ncbi:MAG: PleD family two-component system response regulator [Nitrospinota bacterium]
MSDSAEEKSPAEKTEEGNELEGFGQLEQSTIDLRFRQMQDAFKQGHKKRVLVVDDDRAIRDFARVHLTIHNYDVSEVNNGRDALRIVSRISPDVVLLDLMMPALDGLSVCRCLKGNVENRKPPVVIIMTRMNDKSHMLQAVKAGADDYIVKPFTGETLIRKVTAHLV